MKTINILPSEVVINKFSQDFIQEYKVDQNADWVGTIIKELEEDNDDDFEREAAKINIEATIARKNDKFLGDHLPCGRCLAPIRQEIELAVNAAFLHDTMEKMPEYQEVTTVYADSQEMELYFYHKGIADIKELYHEQLFSEMAPFPRCEGECKGQIYF
jgi:hypothetical protein